MSRETLIEGFVYDRWAKERWLAILGDMPDPTRASGIFRHIVGAQNTWLKRCLSEEEVPDLPEDPGQAVIQAHEGWVELLQTCDPGAFVAYTNLQGESHFNTVEQIARHVVNHGTYHRGHLRGLCEAAGFAGFPETDFIRFAREELPGV